MIKTYRWQPPAGASVKPVGIYLMHGTGEHAGRYQRLVEGLTQAGFVVGAHDHPGHGQSSGKRGLLEPDGCLETQAAIQIQEFARETGSRPIVFGHSLGGVVASELVLTHGLDVRGLILSAPAFVPWLGLADRVKLKLMTLIAPRACLDLGYDPTRLTRDAQMQSMSREDGLNHSFKSAGLINWLIQSGGRSVALGAALKVPTLLLVPGADPVIDPDPTRRFGEAAPQEWMTMHHYDGALHEMLNEIPEIRERVLADIHAWLSTVGVG